jgi:hypothetical protein
VVSCIRVGKRGLTIGKDGRSGLTAGCLWREGIIGGGLPGQTIGKKNGGSGLTIGKDGGLRLYRG